MKKFLNNPQALWISVLVLQLVTIITFLLFFYLRLGNTVFFIAPAWFSMVFTVEFIYLLSQKLKSPNKSKSFGPGWLIWIFILFVNTGIALFFFNHIWFAGIYLMVPLSLAYLIYIYRRVFGS